ncbi:MAG: DUF3108 domain-containing protein [bacterium]
MALYTPAAAGAAGSPSSAFQPGERLTFDLRWNSIPAGTAVLSVEPVTAVGGVAAHHFLMTVRSSPFLDLFYKVRDTIEAFANLEMTHSLLHRKTLREGGYRADVVVRFDWTMNTARYENRGKQKEPIAVPSGTFDPLSVCYFLRLQDLAVGQELQAPVSDGKKSVMGKIRVLGKERVEVPAGAYDAFKLEPELKHLGGVFKRSKAAKMQVWISSDERRLPVKVKSEVKVGHFSAVLASVD